MGSRHRDHVSRETSQHCSSEPVAAHMLESDVVEQEVPYPLAIAGLAAGLTRTVQAKVVVGAAGDPQEAEADRVANAVVSYLRGQGGVMSTTDSAHAADTSHGGQDHGDGSVHRWPGVAWPRT